MSSNRLDTSLLQEITENFCGIYIWLCLSTGKYYLGSTVKFNQRHNNHLNSLKANRHHSKRFQDEWNQNGENSFILLKIRDCKPSNTKIIEQFYLDKYQPWRKEIGLNMSRAASCYIGENNGMFGRTHSEETKQTWSQKRKGVKLSDEHKRKISEYANSDRNIQRGRKVTKQDLNRRIEQGKSRRKSISLISPDGKMVEIWGIKNFCKENNLNSGCISNLRKGIYKQHKGWKLPQ